MHSEYANCADIAVIFVTPLTVRRNMPIGSNCRTYIAHGPTRKSRKMKRPIVAIAAAWLSLGAPTLAVGQAAPPRDMSNALAAQRFVDESLELYRRGQFPESIAASNKALALSPNYTEAYNNICAARNAMGSWDEAIAACVKALELKPDFEIAQNNLARARQMKAASRNQRADDYLNESLALYDAGKYAEAIVASGIALGIRPEDAIAYNNICAANNAMEKWDEAIAACVRALSLKPDFVIAQNNLARARQMKTASGNQRADEYLNESLALYNAGKYAEAIAASRSALRIRPDDAIAYNNICAANNAMQRWDEGIEACTKAIQLRPDFELAKNNMAMATKMKGK